MGEGAELKELNCSQRTTGWFFSLWLVKDVLRLYVKAFHVVTAGMAAAAISGVWGVAESDGRLKFFGAVFVAVLGCLVVDLLILPPVRSVGRSPTFGGLVRLEQHKESYAFRTLSVLKAILVVIFFVVGIVEMFNSKYTEATLVTSAATTGCAITLRTEFTNQLSSLFSSYSTIDATSSTSAGETGIFVCLKVLDLPVASAFASFMLATLAFAHSQISAYRYDNFTYHGMMKAAETSGVDDFVIHSGSGFFDTSATIMAKLYVIAALRFTPDTFHKLQVLANVKRTKDSAHTHIDSRIVGSLMFPQYQALRAAFCFDNADGVEKDSGASARVADMTLAPEA
ncbi:hypothetical protein JKP88DRAFT_255039 [Tribonema minus]|uniref:Uncharacterized protein n=1 Tax=Tribonema minus TaxID=303371 RepID=A0A835Z1I9_9STRA|nr:hypothetical protein JKP88DRAFT_255039 [Tribonema minus]